MLIFVLGSYFSFNNVVKASADNIKPVVVSVKFDKNVVEPGNTINIVVDAYDADSGISSDKSKRIVGINRVGANLTSTTYIKMDYNAEIDKYTGAFTVPLGAINGTWEVSSVQFYDAVGNLYIENPNYSSPNYQSFTVINGSTDNIKPVVVSVKFDKDVAEPEIRLI